VYLVEEVGIVFQ